MDPSMPQSPGNGDARRYRTLVEELPAAFYVSALAEATYVSYVSPGIVGLLGYGLGEWARNPRLFGEILHPLDRDDVLTAVMEAKRSGGTLDAEYRVLRADGSIIWVRDRANTVRDASGELLHLQGFLVDVTDRKDAEARYRSLAEQLPLITYVDTPHSVDEAASYVSPQIEEFLGYTLDEWHSNPSFFIDHLHPDDRDRVRDAQRAARASGEPLELEYRIIAKDGRIVWLLDSYTIVRDETGRPWYAQGYALDVTARKQAEADREALLSQAQLQNERLRELDRMKDEFVALVSHELRTPLTSIRGYLELLLEESEDLQEMHRDWLSVIDRNSERLLALVEDLLLKAQVSAGRVPLTLTGADLGTIVEQCVKAAAPVAAARELELACSIPGALPVAVDPVRIGQAIDNLISNALKFTPPGGTVRVSVVANGKRARVEVADTGEGMSAADQERLFERFYRTERAQTEAVPGVGLGLSIAKALVEAHSGVISCQSAPGKGSTFTIELPLTPVLAAQPVG